MCQSVLWSCVCLPLPVGVYIPTCECLTPLPPVTPTYSDLEPEWSECCDDRPHLQAIGQWHQRGAGRVETVLPSTICCRPLPQLAGRHRGRPGRSPDEIPFTGEVTSDSFDMYTRTCPHWSVVHVLNTSKQK